MKFEKVRFQGAMTAFAILLLLMTASAFAYSSRSAQTASHNLAGPPSVSNDQSGQNAQNQELDYKLVPTANNVGSGEAKVEIIETGLSLHLELNYAKSSSTYVIQVIINGTVHGVGSISTDANGQAVLDGVKLDLQAGRYTIGVKLLLDNAVALQSDPAMQGGTVGETASTTTTNSATSTTTTTTTTSTESEHQSENQSGQHGQNETSGNNNQTGENENSGNNNQQGQNQSHELKFNIIPATTTATGKGEANVDVHGLALDVQAQIEKASPTTQYSLVLSLNGADHTLGTLATNGEGDGEIQAQLKADKPGTYVIGVSLLQGGTLALKGDPASLKTTLTESTAENQNQNQNQEGENVNTVQINQNDEQQIKGAQESKAIPAVVQVTGSGATASVLDSKFSVSVGKIEGNGLAIQISANNVTGPRVLLVNLSNSANLTSHSLLVTLDGNKITQASSVTQVLSPSPGDPARYIVAGTSSGVQLLVSIPHFSLHTIRLLPVSLAPPVGFFTISGLALLGGIIAVSAVFAGLYATRKRIYSIIA